MGIIECSLKCKFQRNDYCTLDECGTVNSVTGECPYFTEESLDCGNGLSQRSGTDKF